jgi:Flp pilus assembly secretin CpaC/tetratricopeptide (TPR) repeat protein
MKRTFLLVLVPMVALSGCRGRRVGPQAAGPVVAQPASAPVVARPASYVAPVAAAPRAVPGVPPGAVVRGPVVAAPPPAPVLRGPVVAEPPPPPPVPSSDAEAARLAGEAARAAAIEAEKRQVLLQAELTAARDAMARGDIEAARAAYGRAIEVDPTNAEAREGWRSLAGGREGSVSDFFERTRREEAVRREAAAAQVKAYLDRGRALEAQEDFEGAIREYQAALAIVSWYANQDVFGVTSDSLRDTIDRVRAKADASRRAARENQIRRAQVERERDLVREREARLGRIRGYFTQADLAYHRGEYAMAREYARAVLRDDPTNCDARNLVELTLEAEHTALQAENRRRFDEEWKKVFLDLEAATLPQVAPVVFPDNWLSDIARRKPVVVGDVGPTSEEEGAAAVIATLDAKHVKNLQWEEQNLDQVRSYLATSTGLNFFITPKVRQTRFEEVKVTLGPLDDVTVREVLDLIAMQYDLRWQVRDGVIEIALKEEVSGNIRQTIRDVKDLAVTIQNHRGTEIYLAPSSFTPPEPPELPEPTAIYPIDALVETIKATIEPTSWEDPAGLEAKNNLLIIKNTADVIAQVDRLLEELRASSGPMVSMEVRFITVEDNFLRDVGVDVRGLGDDAGGIGAPGLGTDRPNDDVFFGSPANPSGAPFGVHPEPSSVGTSNDSGVFYNDGNDGAYQGRVENLFDQLIGNSDVLTATGGLSLQHTFLDDIQLEVILRAVEKSERIQQIRAASLMMFNTQRAVLEVLNKVAYVADYEVEIAQASNIANPVIQYVVEGVVLDVKPVVSADRRFITLELRPTTAELVRPIPTFATSLASGPTGVPVSTNSQVILQTPKLQKSSVRTTVTMPDCATLLIGGLKFYEEINAESGVPFLRHIPVVSFLFTRKSRYVNRRNLIILIRACVIVLEEEEPVGELLPPPPLEVITPVTTIPECAQACPPAPCAPIMTIPTCPAPRQTCPPPRPTCPPQNPCPPRR